MLTQEAIESILADVRHLVDGSYARQSGEWLERAKESIAVSTHARDNYPLVLDHLKGDWVWVYDIEGEKYLDMTAGVASRAFGHHPPELKRLQASLDSVIRMVASTDFDHIPQILLAEYLIKSFPQTADQEASPREVFFTTCGSRAVESAVKSVIDRSRRVRFAAFLPAFHGRTGYALALTASKGVHTEHYPQALPVIRTPYPYPYRKPAGMTDEEYSQWCLDYLRQAIMAQGEDLAAIVVEPIAGEGGIIVPPDSFIRGLRKIANDYGAYLVSDEVQMGLGRTGYFWAIEHYQVVPDYITSAKALGAGFPLGAVIGPKPMYSRPGRHSQTYTAEPYIAIAALYQIAMISRSLDQVRTLGNFLGDQLADIVNEFPFLGEARGRGFAWAVEVVKDKLSREPDPERAKELVRACTREKLLLLPAGRNSIRFFPPLNATQEVLEEVMRRFRRACQFVGGSALPKRSAISSGQDSANP
ncbi:MAG: aminotransferase class III-fold pyridoxal phosphate-dependent enzyme [bacterium JZ-2024 1]